MRTSMFCFVIKDVFNHSTTDGVFAGELPEGRITKEDTDVLKINEQAFLLKNIRVDLKCSSWGVFRELTVVPYED